MRKIKQIQIEVIMQKKKNKNKMAWMPQEFHCHKRQRCLVNGSRLKRLKRYYN